MDDDYLPFHSSPKVPDFAAPAGAVDAHCHVFGPGDVFPWHPARKYTPCDAVPYHPGAGRYFEEAGNPVNQ